LSPNPIVAGGGFVYDEGTMRGSPRFPSKKRGTQGLEH
jgi:hypothetical protein